MKNLLMHWIGSWLAVRTENPEQRRRGRVLGIFLLGVLATALALTLVNVVQLFTRPFTSDALLFILTDLLALAIFVGLLYLNRTGHTDTASYVFLISVVAACSFLFNINKLDRLMGMYVLPTMTASFILGPAYSFVFAMISTVAYSLVYFLGSPTVSYNYVSIFTLFLMAIVGWLAATNLENALREVRKHAEELDHRVMERTADLAEALGKNEAILESIADGVIVFDNDGKATMINPAVFNLLEVPPGYILDRDVQQLTRGLVSTADQQMITGLIKDGENYPSSLKLQWGRKTLSVSAAPIHTAPGGVIGTVAVFRDFTREAEVDRMKSALVSMVSHDLRTPLSAIMGYAEMLLESVYGPLSEKQHSTMERIVANGKRLMGLVNDLLDQAQIEAGKLTLKNTPFIPANLIDGVQSAMSVLAQAQGLELTTHIAADVPATLQGDPQRLHQILINLVGNSLKFTERGGVRVRLYRPDAAHWAMEVSDTGHGIPPDKIDKVFERFYQAEEVETRKYSGVGLGLSIVKQLVTLMNGQVGVKSEVGKGSTFTVLLPLVSTETQEVSP